MAYRLTFAGLIILSSMASIASPGEQPAGVPPAELVRRAVNNELSDGNSGPPFMFKDYRRTPAGSEVKLIVETHQGTAGIEISKDGHPLTAAERQAEDARLENYVDNPDALSKKRKQEKEDADHSARIMRALPDAFLYTPAGTESGSATVGHPGDELLVFNFRPNPNYNPPTHVEQVLTGMKGQVLIDARENRIAEINGTLEKEVGFGWGILGHLDPGGKFFVQQADVGDYHWEVTHMQLSFTGRILFFKKLSIHSNDIFTDFHPETELCCGP
jgi:hypothetical protein